MGLADADLEDVLACGTDTGAIVGQTGRPFRRPPSPARGADRWAKIEPQFASRCRWPTDRCVASSGCARCSRTPVSRRRRAAGAALQHRSCDPGRHAARRASGPFQRPARPDLPAPEDPGADRPAHRPARPGSGLTDAQGTGAWTRAESFFAQESGRARSFCSTRPRGHHLRRRPDRPDTRCRHADRGAPLSLWRRRDRQCAPRTITSIKGKVAGVKSVTNIRAAANGPTPNRWRRPSCGRRTTCARATVRSLPRTSPISRPHARWCGAQGVCAGADDPQRRCRLGLCQQGWRRHAGDPAANDQATPQPSEAQLRAVCDWLDPRRLITTELHVTGPHYTEIGAISARPTSGRLRSSHRRGCRGCGDAGFLHPLSAAATAPAGHSARTSSWPISMIGCWVCPACTVSAASTLSLKDEATPIR